MSEQPTEEPRSPGSQDQGGTGPDPLDGEGEGEGIELTMGEPNTFEPEEDPDVDSEATGD